MTDDHIQRTLLWIAVCLLVMLFITTHAHAVAAHNFVDPVEYDITFSMVVLAALVFGPFIYIGWRERKQEAATKRQQEEAAYEESQHRAYVNGTMPDFERACYEQRYGKDTPLPSLSMDDFEGDVLLPDEEVTQ